MTLLERNFLLIFQAILDSSFCTKAYNACYFLKWSSLVAFVLNASFEKTEYVLTIKDRAIREKVKLKSGSTSKVKVDTFVWFFVDKLDYSNNNLV